MIFDTAQNASKQHVPTQFLTKGSNFWSYFWRRGCIFDMFLGRTYSILDWRCLKYMSYVKKRARARVLDDFVLHPPLQPPLWVATLTCSGRTRASKHKCLGPMEMSTNQPSGQPVGGWEGAKTSQNSNAGSFFGNWRGGVGLRRAIVARGGAAHGLRCQLTPN